jgi:hypothetical protein
MKTLEEKNRMIAEFMGIVESSIDGQFYTKKSSEGFGVGELVSLKYHESWDWLMPVVEKIRKINCYDRGDIFNVQFIISNDRIEFYQSGYTKKESYWYQNNGIESVYNAVIGCITMYNNELKP